MSWTALQYCFRVSGIQLSGGSISLRLLASSVEMNLFKHLFALNMSMENIVDSRNFIQRTYKPKFEYTSAFFRRMFDTDRANNTLCFRILLESEMPELTNLKNRLLEKLNLLQKQNAPEKIIDSKKRELSLIENK